MNVDEAWESFIKSHQIKKASIDEKLDVIASQMNELQTDVSRLAENIPEMQGDAAAMETANAMAEPEMGAEPGLDELGAMMGDEGEPVPEEGGAPVGEEPMPEEGAPMDEGAPMGEEPMPEGAPMIGDGDAAAPGDEISDAELDALLGGEDMGAPEMGGTGNDMIAKIKELIMNEDDPGKLAALSELLAMAASSDGVDSMEGMDDADLALEDVESEMEPAPEPVAEEPTDEEETEPVGKSETFEKTDAVPDTAAEGADVAKEAVDTEVEEAPEPMTKSYASGDLMSRIMEAIMPIIEEATGGASESPVEMPLDMEAEPEIDVEAIVEEIPEEGAPADEKSDEEKEEAPKDDVDSDEEDDEGDDEDEDDPEDDISEETDHFEESDCESEPVMKSFQDLFSQRMESRVGVDGMYAKVPEYMRPAELKDGFKDTEYAPIYKSADEDVGGKHIMTLEEMSAIQKSDRPGATIAVNGEIERPDPTTFKKSGGATTVSFEELMNASDRHELMQKEWDEYNLFKSRY